MIFDKIVTGVLAALNALASLFPSVSIATPAVTGVFTYAGMANRVVPIATAVSLLGMWLVLLGSLRAWDFAVWVYHQFWGSA